MIENMMYRLRFIFLIFRCFFSRPKELLENFDLYFFAVPLLDTDFSRLFTQTYASYMGLARWHYIFGSSFRKVALKNFWAPVTTSEMITYKRSIKAGEKVLLRTQLLYWDERRFFLRQTFFVNSEVRAVALLEGTIRGPSGTLNPVEVFKAIGLDIEPPVIPNEIRDWNTFRKYF